MTSSGAFRSDPLVKAEAVADAAAAGHPGWTNVAPDDDRVACGERFGISPLLVTLLSVASNAPYWDGSTAFLADCVQAIPLGADTAQVARQWAMSRWSDEPYAIATKLVGTPAHAPAREVFEAASGAVRSPLPRTAWRQLRAGLAASDGLTETQAAYAAVAAALAWDEASTPGLYADVWKAWQDAIRIEGDEAAGWDQPTQDAVLEAIRNAAITSHARVSPQFGGVIDTPEAHAAQAVEAAAILDASPLGATATALKEHWRRTVAPNVAAARTAGLAELLSACRGSTTRTATTPDDPATAH